MKNIFKALSNVKSGTDRRSHDVILAARQAARQSAIDPQAVKWTVPSASATWPPQHQF